MSTQPVEEPIHFGLVKKDGWFKFDPNQPTVNTVGKFNGDAAFHFTDASDLLVYKPATYRVRYRLFIPHRLFTNRLKNRPAQSACLPINPRLPKFTPFVDENTVGVLGWVAPSYCIEYEPVEPVRVAPRLTEIYKVYESCNSRRELVWKQRGFAVRTVEKDQKQCDFCKEFKEPVDPDDPRGRCPFCTSAPLPLRWFTPTFTFVPRQKQVPKDNRAKWSQDMLGDNGITRKLSGVRTYWCGSCREFHKTGHKPCPERGHFARKPSQSVKEQYEVATA